MNPMRELLRTRPWQALLMVAIMVTMPLTVIAYGMDDGWSPLRGGAIEPEGWQGGPLEDLLADPMDGDDSLLRMLEQTGAMPEITHVPVKSHVFDVAVPPAALPAFYQSQAAASETPLRDAMLAYNAALDLIDSDDLLSSPEIIQADEVPYDAQTALAVLLYAIADASLLQRDAVAGMSNEDYTALLKIPGWIQSGRLDPTDGSSAADEDFAAAFGLLSQVDKQRIDEAALIMAHATSHVLPTLRQWANQQEDAVADPRVDRLGGLMDAHPSRDIEGMAPDARLDILADALGTAADLQGAAVHPGVRPLPAPEGDHPLRSAITQLSDVTGIPLDDATTARELERADALPASLQEATARIVTNQVALIAASLDLQEYLLDNGLDAQALAQEGAVQDLSPSAQEALLDALSAVRRAEVRVVRAVQESSPIIEGWGLVWSGEQSMLPATPLDGPAKITDAASFGAAMTDPDASLQEIMSLAAQKRGTPAASVDVPLPPRGALEDAVMQLYTRYGIEVDDRTRADLEEGVAHLPAPVEQNTARILFAQLDALGELEALQDEIDQHDPMDLSRLRHRLVTGEFTARDLEALRSHHEVQDRIAAVQFGAATKVAAALDAAEKDLRASEEPEPEPERRRPWYGKAISYITLMEFVPTASAQSTPVDDDVPSPRCPINSPLSDCPNDPDIDKDIWFMDPLLGTVIVSGFHSTTYEGLDSAQTVDSEPSGVYPRGQMLSLDLGGDDLYRNNAGGASSPVMTTFIDNCITLNRDELVTAYTFYHPTAVAVALDLGGDDEYQMPPDGSFVTDGLQVPQYYGDDGCDDELDSPKIIDIAVAGGIQGAAIRTGTIGFLWDRQGDDDYQADRNAQGYGSNGGIGVLIEGGGHDTYTATKHAQGATSDTGTGLLIDAAGNDRYLLTGEEDEEGPFFGQGAARGETSLDVGVGALVDGSGDDRYEGGLQGDIPGEDRQKNSPRSLRLGILIDLAGGDEYSRNGAENGVCQTSLRFGGDALDMDTGELRDELDGPYGLFVDLDGGLCSPSIGDVEVDVEAFVEEQQRSIIENATDLESNLQDAMADPDGDGYPNAIERRVGTDENNATDYPAGLPQEKPADWPDGVEYPPAVGDQELPHGSPFLVNVPGIFMLGDAGDTIYPGCGDAATVVEEGPRAPNGLRSPAVNSGHCDSIILMDIEGDDEYQNRAGAAKIWSSGIAAMAGLAVDFRGDDQYLSGEECTQACNGMLLDLAGDDQYEAKGQAQGVSVATDVLVTGEVTQEGASGVLYDGGGDDRFTITDMKEDAAAQGGVYKNTFGIGMLLSVSGNDTYNSPAQGVVVDVEAGLGFAAPIGLFLDSGGNDTYQPAGQQGGLLADSTRSFQPQLWSSGGAGVTAFLDAGGDDQYIGTIASPAGPDLSRHKNDRLDAHARLDVEAAANVAAGLQATPALALFWDAAADSPEDLSRTVEAVRDDESSSAFRAGMLGIHAGGIGANTYSEHATLIVDPRGDDTYHNNAGGTVLRLDNPTTVRSGGDDLHLQGDVIYDPMKNYPLASLVVDLDGDDLYALKDPMRPHDSAMRPSTGFGGLLSQGAGFLGTGILFDDMIEDGDDTYVARAMSQGFGLYGWGILWDRSGDDSYRYDPALVRDPTVDAGLAAWSEYETDLQALGQEVWDDLADRMDDAADASSENLPSAPGGAAGGSWTVKVRGDRWDAPCIVVPTTDGSADGPAVAREKDEYRVVFSAFNDADGVWRLIGVKVPTTGGTFDDCGRTGRYEDAALSRRPVSKHIAEGGNDPMSNQLNARFFYVGDDQRLVWQDDRDGTWTLHAKSVSSELGTESLSLGRDGLIAGRDPASSNQSNPDAHLDKIVYQDDLGCDEGWAIRIYTVTRDIDEELAGCGMNVDPRISGDLVTWQTMGDDGSWDIVVHQHAIKGGETRTVARPGDQYDPDVTGTRVIYTEADEDWTRVVRYEFDRNASRDRHVIERSDAHQASLDRSASNAAVWVDTSGRQNRSVPVGSDAWEVHARTIGHPNPVTADPGQERSIRDKSTNGLWLQGASYMAGRGILFDEAGLDEYRGDRFAQGSAATLNAPRSSFTLAQGGVYPNAAMSELDAYGVLVDMDGNDAYEARRGSQGTHFAREVYVKAGADLGSVVGSYPVLDLETTLGIGLLLDLRGNDLYDANLDSQGYGAWTAAAGATLVRANGSPVAQPSTPLRLMLVQSYGLFMDLGGLDGYCYGEGCRAEQIYNIVPLGSDVCTSVDEQVVEPVRKALERPNETARNLLLDFTDTGHTDADDDVGDNLAQAFDDTLEEPLWSYLEGAWPDDAEAQDLLREKLDRTVWSILEEQWPEYPPEGADDLRQILEENLDTTVWSVVADHWPEDPPEGVDGDTWESVRLALEGSLDESVWSHMEDLKEDLAQNLAQNPWPPVDDAWPDHEADAEAALNRTVFQALESQVSLLLGESMKVCRMAEDGAGDQRDTADSALTDEPAEPRQGRNDAVWRQKTRASMGDLESTPPIPLNGAAGRVYPYALHIGGIGMDAPPMDNLNRALKEVADKVIDLTVEVYALAGDGTLTGDEIDGSVRLAAIVKFNETSPPGLEFDRVEYFLDGALIGYEEEELTETRDGRTFFYHGWDSTDVEDDDYNLTIRVHYRHNQTFTLGYEESWIQIDVDNAPEVLQLPDTPFVTDSTTGKALTGFSPYPYAGYAPGHADIAFQIPQDLNESREPEHDGWFRIDVLDSSQDGPGQVIRTLLAGTASSDEVIEAFWDGTQRVDGAYEPVPSGEYWVRISVTDRDPDSDAAVAEERTRAQEILLTVHSEPPRTGCVHFNSPSAPCNGAHDVNMGSKPEKQGQSFRVPLYLSAENGAPPMSIGELKRFHVFEREWIGGAAGPWRTSSLQNASSEYGLVIQHGQTIEVVVLGEDHAGHLECLPDCFVSTDSTVDRGQGLHAALENKLDLGEFADGAHAGRPVSATFTADFVRPTIVDPRFELGGRSWDLDAAPRIVGNMSDLRVHYTVIDTGGQPVANLRWDSRENNTFDRADSSENDELAVQQRSSTDSYDVSWTGWEQLVEEDGGWPEGLVRVTVDAEDLGGNAATKRYQGNIILDRTAPALASPIRVEYLDDGSVDLRVFPVDPAIRGSQIHSSLLRLEVGDSPAIDDTVAPEGCTLQFDPTECFMPQFGDGMWTTNVPVDPELWEQDSQRFRIPINITDPAGNTNETGVDIIVGAPVLHPQPLKQEPGVRNVTLVWSTREVPAEAYLEYGLSGDDPGQRVFPESDGTEHRFFIDGLQPGTKYVYRFFAEDDVGAVESSPLTTVSTLHGVNLEMRSPDSTHDDPEPQILTGLYKVKGTAWVQSAREDENLTIEPRVVVRLYGPGLPDAGRPVFDGFTEADRFSMDLVTDALQDGVYSMEIASSYLGETNSTTVERLLVDNTVPRLHFIDPADEAVLNAWPDRVRVRVQEDGTRIDLSRVALLIDGEPAQETTVRFIPDGEGHDGVIEIDDIPRVRPGIHRIEVFADDRAQNPGHASIKVLFDPDAPTAEVGVMYPAGQETAQPGQWVTVYADDGPGTTEALADTTALGGASGTSMTRQEGRHVLETRIPVDQTEGTHPVPLTIRDTAGNVAQAEALVVVDAAPPRHLALDLAPVSANASIIQVNASEPVQVFVDAVADGRDRLQAIRDVFDTEHIVRLEGLQAGTEYDVRVRILDRSGQEDTTSETWRFLPQLGDVPAVEHLVATADPDAVLLEWTDLGAGFRYAVFRSAGGAFETMAVAEGATYTDDAVEAGASYRYFVQGLAPDDNHGAPSEVIDVQVPVPEHTPVSGAATVDVRPRQGVADETEFVFTATIHGAEDADPATWLVLGDESRRMTKGPGQDCRDTCEFRHTTRLAGADLRNPDLEYYIQVFDTGAAIRMPEDGSLPGPTVLVASGADPGLDQDTPGGSALVAMLVLLGTIALIRRRDSL